MKDNKYKGTQTEKNLEAAFAGESQARNKYTYFASKAKKEGYEQIAALFLQQKTFWTPPKARTTSGPICMKVLQRLQRKKASRSLPRSSAWSPRSRSTTRSATELS